MNEKGYRIGLILILLFYSLLSLYCFGLWLHCSWHMFQERKRAKKEERLVKLNALALKMR